MTFRNLDLNYWVSLNAERSDNCKVEHFMYIKTVIYLWKAFQWNLNHKQPLEILNCLSTTGNSEFWSVLSFLKTFTQNIPYSISYMPCLSMSQFLLISHAKWCRLKLCEENYLSWNYCVSWFAYLTCCDSFKILKLSRGIHKPLKTPRKAAFEIIASVKISWKT